MTLREQLRNQQIDKAVVADLILKERLSRDRSRLEQMASCYHPESYVDVLWFKGNGLDFVRRSREQFEARSSTDKGDPASFHEVGATIATIKQDRAIAETFCVLHSFLPLDGFGCKLSGYVHLLWRMQKCDEQWLISGMRCIYIRDLLTSSHPSLIPELD